MMGRRILPESPALIQRAGPMAGPSARGALVQAQRRSWEPDAGFTLLEVLVALTILGLAVVTLIQLSSRSLLLVKTSADYQEAAQLADRIATEKQPSEEGVDSGQEGRFQWERQVSLVPVPDELQPKETVPDQEPLKLFAVTIAVRWGQNQVFQLATLRTPTTSPVATQTTSVGGPQPTSPSTALPTTPSTRKPITQ
jgi:prepilin-type N-terminal cleavage/methylation domain-containing protein